MTVSIGFSAASKARRYERTVQVQPLPENCDGRALARELMQQEGLRGTLQKVEPTPGGYHLQIGRVGTSYAIDYDQETRAAMVRTTTLNFMGMLNRFHHIGTVRSPSLAVNALGVLVFLISVCLILLVLSGLYLWFQFHQERAMGSLLPTPSVGYGLMSMILIRMA